MSLRNVVTNACVIAFSSTFIPRLIYRLHNDSNLDGYINNTLSVFNTNDYERTPDANYTTNITICYYHGRRYPPDHPKKYSLRDDFFYQLLGQLAFVLVFEHVIVLIKVLLMSTIREVPRFVKARLRTQKIRMRDERMKLLSENYHKNYSSLFAKSVQLPQRN
ncbi:Calcium-activated chloride channel [Popillia japonica]|uniref:Anoctamin n=1 Tax=Popillia japonica TaxID=7064 RepID=A0AAW1MH88_POPJA